MSSIDVVVPCYRYARYLRECVDSILAQAGADIRVLILDDESPDDTPEVGTALAAQDDRVGYRRHARNRGHIATYNEGIEWASADYMLLLSADDYLLPGALARAIDWMEAHPAMGLCFGEALELSDGGSVRPIEIEGLVDDRSAVSLAGIDFLRLCINAGARNIVPTPTAIVRTSLLKKVGGYREDLPHTGDLELWLRLAAYGSIGIVKDRQAVYRRHVANMSLAYSHDNSLLDVVQRKAAIEAFVSTCSAMLPDPDTLRLALLDALARDTVGLASSAFNDGRVELSRLLCDVALDIDPLVRSGVAWNALAFKKRLGSRMVSLLLPAVAGIRDAAMRLRGG